VRPVILFALLGWGVTSWMKPALGARAQRQLNQMEVELKTTQAPYEIRPRIFIEQFPICSLPGGRDRRILTMAWCLPADTTQRDR